MLRNAKGNNIFILVQQQRAFDDQILHNTEQNACISGV